jgi:periplasmic protein TonB
VRELFRQVSDPEPSTRGGRVSALPVSMAVHVAVLLALVVIPLLASDVLPMVRSAEIEWTPIVLPTVPPALPTALARRSAPQPVPDGPPLVVPNGIGRERMLVTTAAPEADAPGGGGVVAGPDLPPGVGTVVSDTPPPPRVTAPVRVSTLLRPPARVYNVNPVYPEAARIARVQGIVVIEAVISPTGDVVDAKVLRSRPLLDEAALAAVRQWRYTPSLLNGSPVPVVMTVTVNFTLQ